MRSELINENGTANSPVALLIINDARACAQFVCDQVSDHGMDEAEHRIAEAITFQTMAATFEEARVARAMERMKPK